jgi:hypothetical protein
VVADDRQHLTGIYSVIAGDAAAAFDRELLSYRAIEPVPRCSIVVALTSI